MLQRAILRRAIGGGVPHQLLRLSDGMLAGGTIVVSSSLLGSCAFWYPGPVPSSGSSGIGTRAPLALVDVTVVDVRTGQQHSGQTVVVTGTRIQAVGAMGKVRLPPGAHRVAAHGKYLIPGLWDMHIHPMGYPDVVYPLLIANGVTGIREPGTPVPLATVLQWRREVAAGTRVGPRVVLTGAALDDNERGCNMCSGRPINLGVHTPAQGRRAVDSLRDAGADFVKVHLLTPRAVYFAIADEARRVGLPFSGHLPDSVSVLEASNHGQQAIDHFDGVVYNALRSTCLGDSARVETCAPIARRLRRNGTWLVPTLMVSTPLVGGPARSPAAERESKLSLPRMCAYQHMWPDSVYKGYFHSCEPRELAASVDSARTVTAAFSPPSGLLSVLRQVKMPLLAGTDAAPLLPLVFPGLALHSELALMVAEGLTPLGALQAATLNPARFLRATDSLGTIAPGKLADLVLLDANPLADIHNTQRIAAVVANGRYFPRARLDSLLRAVERATHP